jgi:D-alanyl-D-alanine carboxypeptidase
LLDYGFDKYQIYEFNKKDVSSYSAVVKGGEVENVSLSANESVRLLLNAEELQRLEIRPQIPSQTIAPVKVEQKLGTLEYWLDGKMLKQVALQTEFVVQKQSFLSEVTFMLTNLSDRN